MPPLPTRAGPTSNCGLISATSTAPGRASASAGGSALASEMNERSATIQSGGGTCAGGRSRAFSPSMTRTRGSARSSGASWPWPDVDRPDLRRPRLEQHLAEAAGRGAEIERHRARRVEPEGLERVPELQRRPRDVGQGIARQLQPRPLRHPRRGRAAAAPSSRTTPAAISACARARLAASPAATSAWSSRITAARAAAR